MASARMMSNLRNLVKAGKVQDDVANNVFSVTFNSYVAEVDYEKHKDFYDLVHSRVPEELQGQGIGTVFAEKIFDYMVSRNKKMKLTCEFLDNVYRKNIDKYKDYVVEADK